ncbi:MAG: hypothetical protein ACI4TT_04025, partial [Christensenellales bacterium]
MLVFGCTDKYANLKITTDAPQTGITLYLGKDTDSQVFSTASFVATVSGAGEDISTNLKYNVTKENIVSINTYQVDEQTEFTLTALNCGSTTLTIFTEEGNKSTTVKINVVKELKELQSNTSYTPFVFSGSSTIIDSAKAIKYVPTDTSQKEVTYKLSGSYAGITVEPNGKITATADVQSGSFEVIATSVDNAGISSQPISVRVFKYISQQDINVSFSDGRDTLTLATSVIPAEVTKMLTFDINTQEDYIINEPTIISSINDIVEVEKIDDNNFKVTGINAGKGTLKFNLVLKDGDKLYENAIVEISVPVEVKQYATNIKLNGSENVVDNLFLYDTYQNQLGAKFVIDVGEENAQDKRFVVSLSDDDQQKITIVDTGNKEIKPYNENGDYDILDNNTTLFIRIKDGYTQESTATIKFLTYDSLNLLCEPTSNKINASLKHGVKSLDVQTSLNQYTDGTYLLGLDTDLQYNTRVVQVVVPKNQFTSYIQTKTSSNCVQIQQKISYDDATKNADSTVFDFELTGISEDVC